MPRNDIAAMAAIAPLHPALKIPVSYRDEWQDGLGARGWKLDRAIGDPVLIAVTAYTGAKVPTSVLIHDILDHYISGFGLSGHRNEAKAALQLGLRTGAEIASSYAQLAEDIIIAGVNGEPLAAFLPPALRARLPLFAATEREMMAALVRQLGHTSVKSALIEHMWELGDQGRSQALIGWSRHGFDYARRGAIGMCLQQLLEDAERAVEEQRLDAAQGHFTIGNQACAVSFTASASDSATFSAQLDVDVVMHPTPKVSTLTLRGCST